MTMTPFYQIRSREHEKFESGLHGKSRICHRDYKRIEAASRDELRDKLNKSNGGQI